MALTLTPSASAHSLSGKPRLCADVEELRVGQFHAGLAGLDDLHAVAVNVVQRKQNDLGKIALYARFLGDCLAQVNGETQRHAGPVIRPALALAAYIPR